MYPFFVATLYQIDITWLNALTSANLLLTFVMLVCWWRLSRIYVVDMYLVLAAFLLIACHQLHLQLMLTPITDIAGAAVVAVFYLALHCLIGDGKLEYWRRPLSVLVVAIYITVGRQTRIALLPLVSVPAGLAVLLRCGERNIREQQVM